MQLIDDPTSYIYGDTDSMVVRIRNSAKPVLPIGSALGQLTDETEKMCGPGQHIQRFVSLGPKVYGMQYSDGQEVVKCKGIRQNYHTQRLVTFDRMKAMLDENRETGTNARIIEIKQHLNIVRNKYSGELINRPNMKKIQQTLSNRIVGREDIYRTYPIGWNLIKNGL
jgi:hypothetical protein